MEGEVVALKDNREAGLELHQRGRGRWVTPDGSGSGPSPAHSRPADAVKRALWRIPPLPGAPRARDRLAHRLPQSRTEAAERSSSRDRRQCRDVMYVADAIAATVAAMERCPFRQRQCERGASGAPSNTVGLRSVGWLILARLTADMRACCTSKRRARRSLRVDQAGLQRNAAFPLAVDLPTQRH